MLPHPLTNFETQRHYQNEPRFNSIYSNDNLPNKIKDRTYVISLDEYTDIGTQWIALYALNDDVIYFDSLGVKSIPKEVTNTVTNIFRVQAYVLIIWG